MTGGTLDKHAQAYPSGRLEACSSVRRRRARRWLRLVLPAWQGWCEPNGVSKSQQLGYKAHKQCSRHETQTDFRQVVARETHQGFCAVLWSRDAWRLLEARYEGLPDHDL